LVKTAFVPVLASPRIEAKVMRGFILVMIFASFGTLVNSLILNHTGVSAYGISPLEKASKAFVVPLFLMLLVVSTFIVGSRLSSFQVDRALRIGFYLTCAYTAMQVISAVFTFPPYDYFWPIVEGARPRDTSYIERSNRVESSSWHDTRASRFRKTGYIIFPSMDYFSGSRGTEKISSFSGDAIGSCESFSYWNSVRSCCHCLFCNDTKASFCKTTSSYSNDSCSHNVSPPCVRIIY